jgi:hypothetical protein
MTGWQPDGSYVPCPECGWTPAPEPRNSPGGEAVRMPGTTHHGDCPTVQILTPAERRALTERLIEMDRVRRRGAAEARNFVIG